MTQQKRFTALKKTFFIFGKMHESFFWFNGTNYMTQQKRFTALKKPKF